VKLSAPSIDFEPCQNFLFKHSPINSNGVKLKVVLSSLSEFEGEFLAERAKRTPSPRIRQEVAKDHMTSTPPSRNSSFIHSQLSRLYTFPSLPPPPVTYLRIPLRRPNNLGSATPFRPLELFGESQDRIRSQG
jgi:hypothetical protein